MLDRSWWCHYCMCCGLACSAAPVTANAIIKCVCCISNIETIELCEDACCTCIQGCCCCYPGSSFICQCTPKEGSPCCICCGFDFFSVTVCCCCYPGSSFICQ